MSPSKPGEKTYAELVAALASHFNPTPSTYCSEILVSLSFPWSVVVFVSQLHALSDYCDFNDMLEDMLHDRIVCGINDDTIQRRLLAECELSFKKAVEAAQSMETAARDVKELLKPLSRSSTGILKVNQSPGIKDKLPMDCHRCGKPGHWATQ